VYRRAHKRPNRHEDHDHGSDGDGLPFRTGLESGRHREAEEQYFDGERDREKEAPGLSGGVSEAEHDSIDEEVDSDRGDEPAVPDARRSSDMMSIIAATPAAPPMSKGAIEPACRMSGRISAAAAAKITPPAKC
jgi:hypothetical protein